MSSKNQPHAIALLALAPTQIGMLNRKLVGTETDLRMFEANTFAQAQATWEQEHIKILLLPVTLNNTSSLPFIRTCLTQRPELQVIVAVTHNQIDEAAEAMRCGVADCLFKPFSEKRLLKSLMAAKTRITAPPALFQTSISNVQLPRNYEIKSIEPRPISSAFKSRSVKFIGSSTSTQSHRKTLKAAAKTRLPVFIFGEVGAGKTLAAQSIHAWSTHAKTPYHTLNCATITPESLSEAHLTSGGTATFFLDEVCDLSLEVQARLIRIIDLEGPRNARIIAASCIDPEKAIREGRLRRDLYHRLSALLIFVPPLRARGADISELAHIALVEFATKRGSLLTSFSKEVMQQLLSYSWPGNIRQLINTIRGIVLVHGQNAAFDQVTANMLPQEFGAETAQMPPGFSEARTDLAQLFRGQSLALIEQRIIEALIEAEGGSVTRAALLLDVAPSTLYRKRQSWSAK